MGVLAAITREPLQLRLPYLLVYDIAFVAPLVILLAVTGNRRVLNTVAHAYMQERSVFKVATGMIAVALGFAILVTA